MAPDRPNIGRSRRAWGNGVESEVGRDSEFDRPIIQDKRLFDDLF